MPGAPVELGARRRAHVVARERGVDDADVLRPRSLRATVPADPEDLDGVLDVGEAAVRGLARRPPLHLGGLELLGAPARPAHEVVVMVPRAATPVDELVVAVLHGVEAPDSVSRWRWR